MRLASSQVAPALGVGEISPCTASGSAEARSVRSARSSIATHVSSSSTLRFDKPSRSTSSSTMKPTPTGWRYSRFPGSRRRISRRHARTARAGPRGGAGDRFDEPGPLRTLPRPPRWLPDGKISFNPDNPDGWAVEWILNVLIAVGHVRQRSLSAQITGWDRPANKRHRTWSGPCSEDITRMIGVKRITLIDAVVWVIGVEFDVQKQAIQDSKADIISENAVASPDLRSRPDSAITPIGGCPMKSPGRNKPCPCGSGGKYKLCCYRTQPQGMPVLKSLASSRDVRGNILGVPGQQIHFIGVSKGEHSGDPDCPAGRPGKYKVTYLLAKPGRAQAARDTLNQLAIWKAIQIS